MGVLGMKLNVEVNSGVAYLLSFAAVVGLAVQLKASFAETWIAIAALYGWHTGRRLWRQLKTPGGVEIQNGEEAK